MNLLLHFKSKVYQIRKLKSQVGLNFVAFFLVLILLWAGLCLRCFTTQTSERLEIHGSQSSKKDINLAMEGDRVEHVETRVLQNVCVCVLTATLDR